MRRKANLLQQSVSFSTNLPSHTSLHSAQRVHPKKYGFNDTKRYVLIQNQIYSKGAGFKLIANNYSISHQNFSEHKYLGINPIKQRLGVCVGGWSALPHSD